MRVFLLAAVLCSSFIPRAVAQARDPWLIIPEVSIEDDAWIRPIATKVRSALEERGIEVWSLDSATTRFEADGSAPAAKVTEGDIERWAERSNSAIRSLAKGDYATALDELSRAQQLSLAAAEELSRERAGSRRVLDTCLYIVRALLETGSGSRAETMMLECRRLVPRGDPSALMHPPAVVEMLERVDAARSEQTGLIRVGSRPSGCAVRINGVMLGGTPFELRDLYPGQYRVQVECSPERRGRVHMVDVIAGPAEVFLDLRFDAVIRTDPMLYLQYSSRAEQTQFGITDAEAVADVVPAGAVVLVTIPVSDALDLSLYRGSPLENAAMARIPSGPKGPSREDLALAARTLADGRCTDFTGPSPVALLCGKSELEPVEEVTVAEVSVDHSPRRRSIAGWTLLGVGSASLATGYVLMAPRANVATDWIDRFDATGMSDRATQQKWKNLGTGIIATSSAGAAVLVGAMPLVLPKRAKTPWWAWLSGGVGVGAVVASAVLASTVSDQGQSNASCKKFSPNPPFTPVDARICVKRAQRTDWAVLVGVTAAPLFTIPLVYLLRPKGHAQVHPELEIHRAGGALTFRGRF